MLQYLVEPSHLILLQCPVTVPCYQGLGQFQKDLELKDFEQKELEVKDFEQKELELKYFEQKELELKYFEQKELELKYFEQKEMELKDFEQKELELNEKELILIFLIWPNPTFQSVHKQQTRLMRTHQDCILHLRYYSANIADHSGEPVRRYLQS